MCGTIKQKQLPNKIIENGGNVSKAMKQIGYSEASARNPQKFTQSRGFLEVCEEVGLTDNFILKALCEDIAGKPLNRSQELALASKIKGMQTEKHEVKLEEVKPILQLGKE